MRGTRILLIGPTLAACLLTSTRASSSDWQNPTGVCVDSRGCGSNASNDSDAFSSGPPSIAWGKMTKRAVNGIEACGSKPACVLLRTATWLPMGLMLDAPIFLVKGVVHGGYYGAKGFYYGARGLGKGVAYTGRAIGRGLAYPFNRPPKPILPPTTWEQYKHDVLRHQKRLAKANKANKENQRWCVKNVPLEISPNRAKWESLCNAGDAISRAALPPDVIAAALIPAPSSQVAVPTTPAVEPPKVTASPPGMKTTPPVEPAIPALKDPEHAGTDSDAQAKTAGAGGFDNTGAMSGEQSPSPNVPIGVTADVQSASSPPSADGASGVSAIAPPTNIDTDSNLTPKVHSAPESMAPTASAGSTPSKTPPPAPAPPKAAVATPATASASPMSAGAPATATTSAASTTPSASAYITPKFITIEDDADFKPKVLRDLQIISQTPSGKALLKSLESSGKTIRITPAGADGNAMFVDLKTSRGAGLRKKDGTPGPKADSIIEYDPDKISLGAGSGGAYDKAKWANPPNRPADIGLFHEMVHADDYAHGRYDETPVINPKRPGPADYRDRSEMRAVGLIGTYSYTENTYRSERLTADGKPLLPREFY